MYQEVPRVIKRVGRPKLSEARGQVSTREKILEVATALFLQKGYASVSVNEITELVQVTKPTLYHYFGDKENLYLCVLKDMIRSAGEYFEELLTQSLSYEERIKLMTTYFFTNYSGCCVSFLFKDVLSNLRIEQVSELRQAFETAVILPMSQIFAGGMVSGQVRQGDSSHFAWMAMNVLDGLAFQCRFLENFDEDQLADSFMAYFSS